MGEIADALATKAGISRDEQDQFALESHRRAVAATEAGEFAAEIVRVPSRRASDDSAVSRDEGPRADTDLAQLARLKPAFRTDGTITAGNSSMISDGAAAVVVAFGIGGRAVGPSAACANRRLGHIRRRAAGFVYRTRRSHPPGRCQGGRSRSTMSICSKSTKRLPCKCSRACNQLGTFARSRECPWRCDCTRPPDRRKRSPGAGDAAARARAARRSNRRRRAMPRRRQCGRDARRARQGTMSAHISIGDIELSFVSGGRLANRRRQHVRRRPALDVGAKVAARRAAPHPARHQLRAGPHSRFARPDRHRLRQQIAAKVPAAPLARRWSATRAETSRPSASARTISIG